ncbi:MAG: endolytic transglycosylase MltG [Bacteroidia bacterium]|nr:endolytic transglycosylase MltG [Bacteroidia bacterium]
MSKSKKKGGFLQKIIISFLLILVLGIALLAYELYSYAYKPNTAFNDKKNHFLYIKSTDNFNDILNQLTEKQLIKDINTFKFVAELKKYPLNIKPGKYRINQGLGNNQLVNLLKAGFNEKVQLNFYNINTLQELSGKVSRHIEADSLSVADELTAADFEERYGIPLPASLSLVISNEYQLNWATSTSDFFKLLKKGYKEFWNNERSAKAKKLELTYTQVAILASIIQKEQSQHPEERPQIASVYYNRLKKGMKLQADPTVIFAVGDFTINRVLNKHLQVESPYNTYLNEGLPPGPICIPTKNAIDAVLNLKPSDNLFFCAKEDFSGYHYFTNNYATHLVYAKKYQNALDKKGIK